MKNILITLAFMVLAVSVVSFVTVSSVKAASGFELDFNDQTVSFGGSSGSGGEDNVKSLGMKIYDWIMWLLILLSSIYAAINFFKVITGQRDALKQFLWALGGVVLIGSLKWLIPYLLKLGEIAG